MFNTYGIDSINGYTFNQLADNITFPKQIRDVITTALRLHNLCLNILGYIPGVSIISGSVRILSGIVICTVTGLCGDRNASHGCIIKRLYDEAMITGIAQIARGALEAFIPFGKFVNAALDVIGTPVNLHQSLSFIGVTKCPESCTSKPHAEPDYPWFFWPLNLV